MPGLVERVALVARFRRSFHFPSLIGVYSLLSNQPAFVDSLKFEATRLSPPIMYASARRKGVDHDLIVIGAGPGGYVAAIRAAELGLNVGCIEKEPALGGTCLRVGCIPSKALLESSHLLAEAQHKFAAHGIRTDGTRLDLPTMLGRKNQIVSTLAKGIEGLFKKHKITRYQGYARIAAPGCVAVSSPAGEATSSGETMLDAKHILIATGSKSGSLPGIELDGERVATSTEAL